MKASTDHDIIHLSFISPSKLKIAVLVLGITAIGYGCALHSLLLGLAVPLLAILLVVHAVRNSWAIVVKCFYWKHEWGNEEAGYLAVYTPASRQGGRHSISKIFVQNIRSRAVEKVHKSSEDLQPRIVQEERAASEAKEEQLQTALVEIIFTFNEVVYRAVPDHISRVTDIQKLKLLGIGETEQYLSSGLTPQLQLQSSLLFSQQTNYLQPSVATFLFLKLKCYSGWLFLSTVSYVVALQLVGTANNIEKDDTALALGIPVASLMTNLLLILIESILESRRFSDQYGWIADRKFIAIRNSSEYQVAVHELMVGDVVRLQGEAEYTIWFRGLLAGKTELIVREGLKEVVKFPLRLTVSQFDANIKGKDYSPNTVTAHSKIEKGQIRQDIFFIVTDPTTINNYFQRWFEKPERREFPELVQRFWNSAMLLSLVGVFIQITQVIFVIVAYVVLSVTNHRTILPIGSQIKGFLAQFLLIPHLLFLLERLVCLYLSFRLSQQGIAVHAPSLQSASTAANLFINFSRLLYVQFQMILYKNKLLGFQTEIFQPSAETLRNGSTYESLLAVIIYLSLGHFQQQNSLLAQAHKQFKSFFHYEGGLGDYEDIEHVSSGKKWELLKVYQENEEGIRSWMVKFDNKLHYLVSQVEGKAGDVFKKLGEKEDSKKKEAYVTAAKELQAEGKLLRIMFFRNLKEERLRESGASGDYSSWSREQLERDYEFGTFLLFDHALLAKVVEDIQRLRDQQQNKLGLKFIASNSREELAGFEHIITNVPFVYGCSQLEIGRATLRKMEQSGCMFYGGGFQDYLGFAVADFTISVDRTDEQFCLPGDATVRTIADVQSVVEKSRVVLDIGIEGFRLAFAAVLFGLLGVVYLDRKYEHFSIDSKLGGPILVLCVFVVLPMLVRAVVEGRNRSEDERGRGKEAEMLHGIIVTNYLVALLIMLGMSFGFVLILEMQGFCKATITLQQAFTRKVSASSAHSCKNIFALLSTTACSLSFICFYGGKNWLKERISYARLLLAIAWAALLFLQGIPMLTVIAAVSLMLLLVGLRIAVLACFA